MVNNGMDNTPRPIQTLTNKKVLNNIRIYTREGPIIEDVQTNLFTRYLPQFLANCAINLILVDAGLSISYPAIVIGYLYNKNNSLNSNGDDILQLDLFKSIQLNKIQSSVYTGLQFLMVPLGSLTGGLIVDKLGRKKVMFIACLPLLASWLMYFFSQNVTMLYFGNILSGIGIGIGEAAQATYQGEVTEPPIRGTIINFALLWFSISLLGPYIIHLIIPSWRWIAVILSVVPMTAGITALIVPESPVWLLSKGEVTLAEKSLKKLRGGATKQEIAEEMQETMSYHNSCNVLYKRHPVLTTSSDSLLSKDSWKEKWNYFRSDRVRKPFILSCVMFALIYLSGISTLRPFINPVLMMMNFHGEWTLMGLTITFAGALGHILAVLLIGYTGKRLLVLTGLTINAISSLVVGVAVIKHLSIYVKLIPLHMMAFVSGYSIIPITSILQSEIYPFRGRGTIAGSVVGIGYIMAFISTSVFLSLTDVISIEVMFIIFSISSFIGVIYLFLKMPETEGRTLQQIEDFFSGEKMILR